MNARVPVENADTVSLIAALLVRFPEIASLRSAPGDGTLCITFALRSRLDRRAQAAFTQSLEEHVDGFLALEAGSEGRIVQVDSETDRGMTFIHVSRDLDTFTKDELVLLTSLVTERFGDVLVRTPSIEEHPDEDPVAQEEAVEFAIEALRDPSQSKSLVGFREEKRVLVYFLKSQKKAKASVRR